MSVVFSWLILYFKQKTVEDWTQPKFIIISYVTSNHCQQRPQGIPDLYRPTQVTFHKFNWTVESLKTNLLAECPELLHLSSPGRPM